MAMVNRKLRRLFFSELWVILKMVWPILSGILLFMASLGVVIGILEGWTPGESMYFAFVSGLTIGYGDLVPTHYVSRILAVVLGFSGIVMTGLIAAIGVRALNHVARDAKD